MILFASGRTDIPAFYADWFMNRLRAGFVDVRNPYYGQQVTRYKLTPDLVDCFVFCTKNPTDVRRKFWKSGRQILFFFFRQAQFTSNL